MSTDITKALQGLATQGQELDAVLPLVYGELKRMAQSKINQESDVITMGATGLLHEAYLRLTRDAGGQFQNRAHFFAAASEAMRRILVERARALTAQKRGRRPTRVSLGDDRLAADMTAAVDVVSLDEALNGLEEKDPEMAIVVKLRYFGGLTVEETAAALTVSPRTVNRTWTAARAWLKLHLAGSDPAVG